MIDFKTLGLPVIILDSLRDMKFSNPTPIQEQAIPIALQGHDILGSAQTGTGKTAAFAIPMISHLLKNNNSSALILLPTRELAVQVLEAAKRMLGNKTDIKSALLIGGDPILKQFQQLKRNPRIIVGTPGRINDHLSRRTLKLNNTDFLVLDETDRMLDMGFGIQLEEIAKFLPKTKQTLMFSATMPQNIVSLSRKYLNNPVRIAIGDANAVTQNIKQEIVKSTEASKYNDLINEIKTREGSLLVFVKTKFGADRLAVKLTKENFSADAIHGDLRQSKRDRVISNFRNQKYRILVATDIAARGLDIPHIENVVNYDLPQCPEDYIHRIGRTARAGAEGTAINLLTPKDREKWKEICKLINPSNRDKAMLMDGPSPVSAKPLNSEDSNGRRSDRKKPRVGDSSARGSSSRDGAARGSSSRDGSFARDGADKRRSPSRAKPAAGGNSFKPYVVAGEEGSEKKRFPSRAKPAAGGNSFKPYVVAGEEGSEKKRFPSRAKPAAGGNSFKPYVVAAGSEESGEKVRAPKAKTSSANPFKPFAPDKKDVKSNRRAKFNKNSKSFGDFASKPKGKSFKSRAKPSA